MIGKDRMDGPVCYSCGNGAIDLMIMDGEWMCAECVIGDFDDEKYPKYSRRYGYYNGSMHGPFRYDAMG